MKIQRHIDKLNGVGVIHGPCRSFLHEDLCDIGDVMERLLVALQEIVDYHQDYDEPLNKDFDAIQDIAIAVLRDIDDPVQPEEKP